MMDKNKNLIKKLELEFGIVKVVRNLEILVFGE